MTAYTPCFRREKMSAGRDVRGIKRGHQFDKVEMVKLVRPETSDEELDKLVEDAGKFAGGLRFLSGRAAMYCRLEFRERGDLRYRDVGAGIGEWLEVSSCSNCTDFQMRRANIRYRPEKGGKTEFIHALNGSGLGLPRTLIAVLENYQQADGSVVIPKVLRPYMGGAGTIRETDLSLRGFKGLCVSHKIIRVHLRLLLDVMKPVTIVGRLRTEGWCGAHSHGMT